MGLNVVHMVKLHLHVVCRQSLGPVVAWIVCPLALKLFLGLRVFRQETVYSTRLFLFQLHRIVFNTEIPFANGTRLDRAFRLMSQTLLTSTTLTSQEEELNQDTFDTLLTLTL